jgi:DNA ligase-1
LRYAVWATYETTRNYYIKKTPDTSGNSGSFTLGPGAWAVLDDLADRKITGDTARGVVRSTLEQLEPESRSLFERILKRDLRIGVAAKGFHKVFPGLLTRFDVMLASPYEAYDGPALVSPKIDGMRVLARVDRRNTKVDFFTRNGKTVDTLNHVSDTLLSFEYPDEVFWVDGEGTAAGGFAESISVLRKKNSDSKGIFNVFDILPASIETGRPTYERYIDLLKSRVEDDQVVLVPSVASTSHEQTMQLYADFRQQGYEGAIVKDPEAGYQLKRSKAWMKIKPTETFDLPVVSAFEGTGKYVGKLGGLTVMYGTVPVNVGSGFSDLDRETLWALWLTDPGQLTSRILEVSCHEVTPDGSLRHPRAKRFRPDK